MINMTLEKLLWDHALKQNNRFREITGYLDWVLARLLLNNKAKSNA